MSQDHPIALQPGRQREIPSQNNDDHNDDDDDDDDNNNNNNNNKLTELNPQELYILLYVKKHE